MDTRKNICTLKNIWNTRKWNTRKWKTRRWNYEQKHLYISCLNLSEIPVWFYEEMKNHDVKKLNCYENQIIDLSNLVLFENLKYLDCSWNQLTSLILPESLKILYCSNNQLTSLILPKNLKYLDCSYNQLTSLILPKGLKELWCYNNPISYIKNINNLKCFNSDLPYDLSAMKLKAYLTDMFLRDYIEFKYKIIAIKRLQNRWLRKAYKPSNGCMVLKRLNDLIEDGLVD